jgi:hypothetical protein
MQKVEQHGLRMQYHLTPQDSSEKNKIKKFSSLDIISKYIKCRKKKTRTKKYLAQVLEVEIVFYMFKFYNFHNKFKNFRILYTQILELGLVIYTF